MDGKQTEHRFGNDTSNVSADLGGKEKMRDPLLPQKDDDPRAGKPIKRVGAGRNTESFDPKSTLVRPDMRIIVGSNTERYNGVLKHDDVVVVPSFFCEEDNWELYYKLVEELRTAQESGEKGSEWISWHEGAHLITKNPNGSDTYKMIQEKISRYFGISMTSVGTRFNWYRDSSDWKPFHHDSAAYNRERARNQNITVGVSFGATRELAFLHTSNGSKLYFPQTNGMMFSFGRDVNIKWKHGVNALHEVDKDGKGRVSIVLWGLCPNVTEEKDSPPMVDNGDRFGGRQGGGRGGGRGRSVERGNYQRDGARGRERDRSRDRPFERDRSRERPFERDRSRERPFERDRPVYRGDSSGLERGNDQRERRSHHSDRRYRASPTTRDSQVCRDFGRGTCRFGDRCRFSHTL